jgi:hypothetical protein
MAVDEIAGILSLPVPNSTRRRPRCRTAIVEHQGRIATRLPEQESRPPNRQTFEKKGSETK